MAMIIKSLNNKLSLKKKTLIEKTIYISLICWILFLLASTIIRVFYGIETTDEAFYISEAVSVIRGNTLYTYNTTVLSGMSLVTIPFVNLYMVLFPNLQGVFLYMRIMFQLFRILILGISFFLLQDLFDKKKLLFSLSLMLPFWGERIPQFSYNTTSLYLLFMTASVCLWTVSQEEKPVLGSFICGVLIAIVEFTHLAQLINVLVFGAFFLTFCNKTRWKNLFAYISGGLLVLIIVLGVVIFKEGWQKFIHAVQLLIETRVGRDGVITLSTNVNNSILKKAKDLFSSFKAIGFFYCFSFLCCSLYKSIRNKTIVLACAINPSISLGLILSCSYCLFRYPSNQLMIYIAASLGFASFLCILDSFCTRKNQIVTVIFLSYPFLMFFLNVLSGTNSPVARAIHFMISGFGISIYLTSTMVHPLKKTLSTLVIMSLIFVAVSGLVADYLYIYREESISSLTVHVEKGIYKGLYTTEQKAQATEKLELFLRQMTNDKDQVLFMDIVPFAYLMSDAVPCTPSTWDRMHFYKGQNDPYFMYCYFEMKDTIPTKIVYISYEAYDTNSIDNDEFEFNQFVRDNYIKTEDIWIDNYYRVRIYTSVRQANRSASAILDAPFPSTTDCIRLE